MNASLLLCLIPLATPGTQVPRPLPVLFRTIDLDVGQTETVTLSDGRRATVRLVNVEERRDGLRQAVREARVSVEVNGQSAMLVAANYRLPVEVGGVQIDCAATQGLVQPARKPYENPWALDKAARLRLWPAGSPWIQPRSFGYPAVQRWFASGTQMSNEPVFIDGGERPVNKAIYYHWGLDIGGTEHRVEVIAASDAVVVSRGLEVAPDADSEAVRPRYDVVYLRDGRGWYHRYSHLARIDPQLHLGQALERGQRIGWLGKEGGSGGWTHLHFDLSAKQPSGRYGIVEGYAFLWQAYQEQYRPALIAVARPHHFVATNEPVELDGSLSWARDGVARYQWQLSDGTKVDGPRASRSYPTPGTYSETLKVTDRQGRIDYDFATVQVADPKTPDIVAPSIHASYWPSLGLKAGDEVTFKVRSFRIRPTEGRERWDFGDGTPAVEVQSDGNAKQHAPDGYAVTQHRYARPGQYLVSVVRTNDRGHSATARLHVTIGAKKSVAEKKP